MKDLGKTKEQLINEPEETRQRPAVSEAGETRHTGGYDLGSSEVKFRALSLATFEGIVFSNGGVIVDVNQQFADIVGYSLSEIPGMKIEQLVAPEDKELVANKIRTGSQEPYEHRMIRKDGSMIYVETHPRIMEVGTRSMRVTAIQDITERKQKEAELRLNSEIISNMSEGIFCVRESDRQIIYTNPKFESMLGYDTGELLGKDIAIINAPTEYTPEEVADNIREHIRRKGSWNGEVRHVRKDGALCWSQVSVSAYQHPEYGLTAVSVMTDITARKRTGEELELRAQLLDNAGDAIILSDLKGNILYVNETFCRSHGYSREELIGKHLSLFDIPEFGPTVEIRIEELKKEGQVEFETTHFRKDGSSIDVEVHARVIESGERNLVLSIERDITYRKEAEEVLLKSEQELAVIFETSSDAMKLIDKDFNVLRVNSALENMFNLDSEIIVGSKCYDTMSSGRCHTSRCPLTRIKATKKRMSFESNIERPDGSKSEYMVTISPVLDEKGEVTGILEDLVDISEHKKMEESLRSEKQRAEQYLDVAMVILAMVDTNEKITMINRKGCEILGYKEEELIGKNWFDTLAPPQGRDERRALFRRLLTEDITITDRENLLLTKDGREILGSFHNTTVRDADGNPIGRLMSGEDITETRKIERQLQISEQNFRAFADDYPLGIMVIKAKEQFTYANKAIVALFGFNDIEDFRKMPYDQRYTKESIDTLHEIWEKEEKGLPVPDQYELGVLQPGGEVRQVEVLVKKTIWDNEEQTAVIYRDVTEHKQLEEQLRHAQVLASLGEMTAGIAHEVGNPLASILLFSEVAMKGDVSRQTKKDLKSINNEARRAGKLMKDLLAYSRKLEPRKRRVNIHDVIEKVIEMRLYQLKVSDINMTTDLFDGPLFVKGNSSQLTQVLINLILNAEEAIRESEGGNIGITTKVEGEWATVSVTDDGPGIPGEYLDQIFLPFFTTKGIGEGTGLGLSTCYGIISAHNGLISTENNEKGGTTFTIKLPLYS